jgi:hypothetical protein
MSIYYDIFRKSVPVSHRHNIRPREWMEDCDYRYNLCTETNISRYILGQDEDGDIFVPLCWAHPEDIYRPFNRWIPLHWLAYFNSWRRREIATLERNPESGKRGFIW